MKYTPILLIITMFAVINADIECVLCEKSVDLVKHLISKNATREEIKKEADKVCEILPIKYRTQCDTFMNENIDKIIDLIDKIPDDQICGFIGFCKKQNENDIKCNICKFLVDQIAKWLEEGKTEDYILSELKKLCYAFHPFDKQCIAIIDAYGKQLIDFIISKGKDKACYFIGLCETNENSEIECFICKTLVDYVAKWLEEEKTEEEIIKDLEKICDEFEGIKKQCDFIVESYTKKIIEYIISFGKDKVCILIHMC